MQDTVTAAAERHVADAENRSRVLALHAAGDVLHGGDQLVGGVGGAALLPQGRDQVALAFDRQPRAA